MHLNPKSVALLSLLVVSIYVMRDGGVSFTSPLSRSTFRRLYDYARPASSTCSDVDLAQSFSSGELDRAKNLQKSLKSIRGGNPLETLLTEGKIDTDKFIDYAKGLIASLAVWAAFFLISIIFCCCACCNWCCMFGCCKGCKCCRCCKQPRSAGKGRVIYSLIALVFMLALFSAGIAGAAFSGSISKGIKLSYCSILNLAEDLAYGKKSEKWLGLKGVVVGLDDIIVQFDSAVQNLQGTTASTFNSMNDAYDDTKDSITAYYNAHNAHTIARPDPAVGGTYNPDFVANLGPIATSGKYLYAIQNELDIKRDALNQAQTEIDGAVDDINSQKATIKDSLTTGKTQANDIFTQVDDLIKDVNDNGDTINTVITAIGKVVLAIFVVYIVVALIPIISILLIFFLKLKFLSKFMHFSWCLMGFLAIIGFIICAVFYPVSIVFTEFCEVFSTAVNDGAYFNRTIGSAMGGGQAKDLTYLCMFGNGAALEQLGVNDSVSHFDTIYSQLDEVNSKVNLSSEDPVPSVTIPYAKWLLDSWQLGYLPDAEQITTDYTTLNALTNKNSNTCTPNQDTWIINSANCTSSNGVQFQSTSGSLTYDQPNPTCIGLNQWSSAAGSSGSARYGSTQFPSSCTQKNGGSQLNYVTQFVDNLETHRGSVSNLFTNLKTAMTTAGGIEQQEAVFGHWAYECLSPFKDIKTKLQGIQASLTGEEAGVIPNTRCQFIGTSMRQMSDALCIGFVSSIYQATVVLIIVSMFSLLGAMCVLCSAKRINVTGKKNQGDAYRHGKDDN